MGGTLPAPIRIGNLTCYLLEHKLNILRILAGRERKHHLFNLLVRIGNSIVKWVILIRYPKLLKCRWAMDTANTILLLSWWLVLTLTFLVLQDMRLLEQDGEVSDSPTCPWGLARSSCISLIARALVWWHFASSFSITFKSSSKITIWGGQSEHNSWEQRFSIFLDLQA